MLQPTGLHTELSLPACLLTPGEPSHERPCPSLGQPVWTGAACACLASLPRVHSPPLPRAGFCSFFSQLGFRQKNRPWLSCHVLPVLWPWLPPGLQLVFLSFQAGALHSLEARAGPAQASPPSRAAWPQAASAGTANPPAFPSTVVRTLPGSRQKRSRSGPSGFLRQGRAPRAVAAAAAAGWGPQQSPSGILPEGLEDPAEGEGGGTRLLPPPISAVQPLEAAKKGGPG